jgi:basic membrane protein A and related proteins
MKFAKVAAICLCIVVFWALLGQPSTAEEKSLKAAFVYIGPVGDHGWTYAHDLGRRYIEKNLGVETAYTENVHGPDIERVIRGYAQKGYDLIFTTSFEYMDPTIEVAADFPETVFEHCSGYKTADNVGNYFGRIYQPDYLSGLVAGKMSESNVLGYVAPHPLPEVIRGINSFTKGVREGNPDAIVKVVWIGSWNDPPKEKEGALSLIDAGADVIAQGGDSPAAQEAAQEKGVYSVGYDSDMSKFAPDAHLTAPVWHWDVFYEQRVQEVRAGTWEPESWWGGMETGIADLSPFGPMVPEEVREMVMQRRQEIIDGTFQVWPDKTDEELLSMNYFIEGVEGELPK